MRWINSAGGPLVLIPRLALRSWQGAAGGDGSDYMAAAAVSDYAGVIHRHGVDILVLNDEPLQTTAVAMDDALLLVRWKYAPSESSVSASLRGIRGQLGLPCEQTYLASTEHEYVLLDAGAAGDGATNYLDIGFCPHQVETHLWDPEIDIGLIVHLLKPSVHQAQ
jgi:hypothetical protein